MRRRRSQTSRDALVIVEPPRLLHLTVNLARAFLAHNRVPAAQLGPFLTALYASLLELSGYRPPGPAPAVPVAKSIKDDFIICLEDGKRLRTLKRYLRAQYKLTPEAYRRKWGLPSDYPMAAPAYARMRSEFAKRAGLGLRQASGRGRRPR
jgi:predicted transcriptional regulator